MALLAAAVHAGGAASPRGDVNGDGQVSISDARFLLNHLFREGDSPGCMEAADCDTNGTINVSDPVRILNHLFLGRPPLGELECASQGSAAPLDDPAALLEVLDVSIAGGEDGVGAIVIALSTPQPAAGYSLSLLMDPAVVAAVSSREARDLTGTLADGDGFVGGCYRDGRLDLGFLAELTEAGGALHAEEGGATVIEVPICLGEGARAGVYPLLLEDGEIVDESGRAIRPRLLGGSLIVAADLSEGAGCEAYPCPRPPDPHEDPPEELNAVFELRGAAVSPDETFSLPLFVRADAWIQGFSFSLDFDEEVLEATAIEKLIENPNGFTEAKFNNRNDRPGNSGVDEGYVYGVAAMSLVGEKHFDLPPDKDHEVFRLHFRLRPGAKAATTQVEFADGARQGNPIINMLIAYARGYTPDTAASFIFVDGHVNVLPEISTFIRGDSNGDGSVNLSDAERTLGHLFLGTRSPACYDAADANDDGAIDITDALRTLTFLFLGGEAIPPPYPAPGEDLTEDLLGCLWRR
jgi:hypothetical protein